MAVHLPAAARNGRRSIVARVLAGFIILAAQCAHAQAALPSDAKISLSSLEVVVRPADGPDTGANDLELELINHAPKDIVAYALQVNRRSPKGHSSILLTTDLVLSMAGVSRAGALTKYQQMGAFPAGGHRYQLTGSSPGALTEVATAVIIFDDNTAIGNRDFIERTFKWHASTADELERILSRFKELRGRPVREHLTTSEKQFSDEWRSQPPIEASTARILIQETFDEFSHKADVPDVELEAWFQQAVSYLSDEALQLRLHSQLAVVTR